MIEFSVGDLFHRIPHATKTEAPFRHDLRVGIIIGFGKDVTYDFMRIKWNDGYISEFGYDEVRNIIERGYWKYYAIKKN